MCADLVERIWVGSYKTHRRDTSSLFSAIINFIQVPIYTHQYKHNNSRKVDKMDIQTQIQHKKKNQKSKLEREIIYKNYVVSAERCEDKTFQDFRMFENISINWL